MTPIIQLRALCLECMRGLINLVSCDSALLSFTRPGQSYQISFLLWMGIIWYWSWTEKSIGAVATTIFLIYHWYELTIRRGSFSYLLYSFLSYFMTFTSERNNHNNSWILEMRYKYRTNGSSYYYRLAFSSCFRFHHSRTNTYHIVLLWLWRETKIFFNSNQSTEL